MSEKRVVNTSPLIYLSRADMIDLLRGEVESVVVPREVADEIMAWPTADTAQKALQTLSWLTIADSESVPGVIAAWDLGKGESAVLSYAISHPGFTVVVDDLAARRCAAALDIPLRGTLGLVLRGKKRGKISSAREALKRLREAGTFLSEEVADNALREVGE